jgi:filamentous hemagglutinin
LRCGTPLVAGFCVLISGLNAYGGDILRGGNRGSSSQPASATSGAPTPGATDAARTNAQDILLRATQTTNAMNALQAAAQAAAASGANNLGAGLPVVPNGLGVGGLQVTSDAATNTASWSGAALPTQTVSGDKTTVTIKQTTQQALLTWQTFNVGKQTTLTFDQTAGGANAGQWIAFNKINDPTGNPTQILGSIHATGQVYIINQNGIIFGGSSQVNTQALTASSLPINDNLVAAGLLNNPDLQFLFSALPIAAGSKGPTPSFTPPQSYAPNGTTGDVVVQAGAQISSPTIDNVGGRVSLIGGNVSNQGSISTPDGQTILAAGLQVGFVAHNSSDPSLRGLDVYIGAVSDGSSAVYGNTINSGLINAPRADVWLAGRSIAQNGVIQSTTSVSLNGRIDINASYGSVSNLNYDPTAPSSLAFFSSATGSVSFGANSNTNILPELSSTETIIGNVLALPSQINVLGQTIYMGVDSNIVAPSANITMKAGVWDYKRPLSFFVQTNGQIYLDTNSQIYAGGSSDVTANVSENIVAAQLLGAELANSPLLRDSPLRGATIMVDVTQSGNYNGTPWVGTPLADVSGYANLIQRTVGELTTAGGKVSLSAGSSVVIGNGAKVDVAGGWINYQGGDVQTTRLLSGGNLIDIANATPDLVYGALVQSNPTVLNGKWGVSQTYNVPLVSGTRYVAGYVQGGNGGSLQITAPSMALNGTLTGTTVTGQRQLSSPPVSSALSLVFQTQQLSNPNYLVIGPAIPPTVVFSSSIPTSLVPTFSVDSTGNPAALPLNRQSNVYLPVSLVSAGGFGNLNVTNGDGDVILPQGETLATTAGGSITIAAANVDILGTIFCPDGSISITAFNISPFVAAAITASTNSVTPPPNPDRGLFHLASSAILDTSGLVVDDRSGSSTALTLPHLVNGGAITVNSYNAQLDQGGAINVSGGAAVSARGVVSYGNAGSISIQAGHDAEINSVVGGRITMGASLIGMSGATGGSLSLAAPAIQVGGSSSDPGVLVLDPSFFQNGGFSSYSLTGVGSAVAGTSNYNPAIVIASGTTIDPVTLRLLANLGATGADGITFSQIVNPAGLRTPISLSFNAPGLLDQFGSALLVRGDLVMQSGSAINAGPMGSVSFRGNTVSVSGAVTASGGKISISGASQLPSTDSNPLNAFVTVDLAPSSMLSVAGSTLLIPNGYGFRTGTVLNGGTITVSGNIAAEQGAVLNVSGASDVLDFPSASLVSPGLSIPNTVLPAGLAYSSARIDSTGGSISLHGSQELFCDATLVGASGGVGGVGGTLSISSGSFLEGGGQLPPNNINLIVQQNGRTISAGTLVGVTQPILESNGSAASAMGHFTVASMESGGFDSLTLGGNVQFSGPVTIQTSGSLNIANGGVLGADSHVNLTSSHVTLGQSFSAPVQPQQIQGDFTFQGNPFHFAPTFGSGSLQVNASLIDLGTLSLQGIGTAGLTAANGDVRGNGTFDMAGNLSVTAGQIYPTTASIFTLAAYDYNQGGVAHAGSITIAADGNRPVPYSAAGQLNLLASTIVQGGTLRAPFGTIQLGWNGSGISPVDLTVGGLLPIPVTNSLTLTSGSITSISAVDPATGVGIIIPYGASPDGTTWYDPSGMNITTSGMPASSIQISAQSVTTAAGSEIDIRGGGDATAYQWISGTGGTHDILASNTSFAVIPGYASSYAPYAPYNTSFPGGDAGYISQGIKVGDRVWLAANAALPAGYYTLLPARYATLPGALLITPMAGKPTGASQVTPEGASVVSGYRYNALDSSVPVPQLLSTFEVAPSQVVAGRAQYNILSANTNLSTTAGAARSPKDSGQIILAATRNMGIEGNVSSVSVNGGIGGIVDINSPLDILIGTATTAPISGTLVLDSAQLSAFGAESLLVGGTRSRNSAGTLVTPSTSNLTVDNAGSALTGSDVILVATHTLTIAPNAEIMQSSSAKSVGDGSIIIGSANVAGSGDGALVRISADPSAAITRYGVDASTLPNLIVSSGATLQGASITMDSTSGTLLSSSAAILGSAVSLNSGQVSIQLDNAGSLWATAGQTTQGIVLSGETLARLEQSVDSLSLLSYSSIDLYGSGIIGGTGVSSIALHAAEIRGFNNSSGSVSVTADNVLIDNSANGSVPGIVTAGSGNLIISGKIIQLGTNSTSLDQFAGVNLTASSGIIGSGAGGLTTPGSMTITSPVITIGGLANQRIVAGGTLAIQAPTVSSGMPMPGGLGGSLELSGASVVMNSLIAASSGNVTLHATTGKVEIGGTIDTSGTAAKVQSAVTYTDGGTIHLNSDTGSVILDSSGVLSVAANAGGGNAGTINVSVPKGSATIAGLLLGTGGIGGSGGSWSLDTAILPSLSSLNSALNASGFNHAITLRVRTGNVAIDGISKSLSFTLSADSGSIDVTGKIDVSGETGGTINLSANENLTLAAGSVLDASAANFSNAGTGGTVTLAAGSETNGIAGSGILTIGANSTINLGVANQTAASAGLGDFSGVLNLRAPQTINGSDLAIASISGSVNGASAIIAQGYKIYDLSASGGLITTSTQNTIKSDATSFASNTNPITSRLLSGNGSLSPSFVLVPGAELINQGGDIRLGTTTSTTSSDWNLSSYRFGPNAVPGILTIKAVGNVVLYNSISDGFASAAYNAKLLSQNPNLPTNVQSWSYQITSGADFSGVNLQDVNQSGVGSVKLGKNGGLNISGNGGPNALTSTVANKLFQVIRTGTGSIDISSADDIQFLNQMAAVYTAGVLVSDPTLGGTFATPNPSQSGNIQQRPPYAVQYSLAGGSVDLQANGDIIHYTQDIQGNLIPDSSREMPTNWLYRRGYVDPSTGQFGLAYHTGEVASTSWWVDFSNFFGSVATFGGGNITMTAGKDISNVDDSVATNARMPGGTPNSAALVELGGGDLTVNAGRDIDAGVYYVERGNGTLHAAGNIHTNSTRSPTLTTLTFPTAIDSPETWLPTTLFLGKGNFDVSAGGDVLLGPVANPFLLPQGYNNSYWYKTYFSTYAPTDIVSAISLAGDVTLRTGVTLNSGNPTPTVTPNGLVPALEAWYQNELLNGSGVNASASYYQPWLRLSEALVNGYFNTQFSLLPPTLNLAAISGNVNLAGNVELSPAPLGNLSIIAEGFVNGLQITGTASTTNANYNVWSSSTINLSDANPSAIPGVASPLAYQSLLSQNPQVGKVSITSQNTSGLVSFLDPYFIETGATNSANQTKQLLHSSSILHASDSKPVTIYAAKGDISGLTLYSAKPAQIIAGNDITDISAYIQNLTANAVSMVVAGRDIIAYNAASVLRGLATSAGNVSTSIPNAGDIQISGPGTLEVLAGRNLDLGAGSTSGNGTSSGITSIGNLRNPYLPFGGADIVAGAGIGTSGGLNSSKIDFQDFITTFVTSPSGAAYLAEIGLTETSFAAMNSGDQDLAAIKVFYLILRDAGRGYNNPNSTGYKSYQSGQAAIQSLFPSGDWKGNISTAARDIRTVNGGSISLFAPGGGLTLETAALGASTGAPPGIITEYGGNISVFTRDSVNLGISRIFTLRGGNEVIWSSTGDIAAGSSSKTVQAAPPTRVLVDPQSAAVKTDLAGLATGGGIGVLTSVAGVKPGNVDLVAPVGSINAGDAGIRVSGNLNIAAATILNAGNISVSGSSAGTPVASVGSIGLSSLSAASNVGGASNASVGDVIKKDNQTSEPTQVADELSIITVEVIGYGGGDSDNDYEKKRKKGHGGN